MNATDPWGSAASGVPAGKPRGKGRLGPSFAVAGLAAVVVGVAVGQVWRLVAPHVPIIKLERGFAYAEGQPEQAVAADGWFGLLGVIAGVLLAIMAWRVLRYRRGAVVLAVLVLGSLVGGWLGWWLGVRLEMAAFETRAAATAVGERLDAPLSLRITDLSREHPWPVEINSDGITERTTGVIVAQALAVAFTYTVLAGFAANPDLRPNPPKSSSATGSAGPLPRAHPFTPAFGAEPGATAVPAGVRLDARPDAVRLDFGWPDPVQPDPVQPDPVQPDPVRSDPVRSDAARPDAVHPRAVRPDPARPDTGPLAGRPADLAVPDSRLSSAPGAPADPKGAPESP